MYKGRWLIQMAVLLAMIGCASLPTDFDPPVVNVRTVRILESKGFAPEFEIGLHIINPNRVPLKLQGIVYTLTIEGYDLVTGVTKDLPVIDGYDEEDVNVTASVSLLESIQFLSDVMRNQRQSVSYRLKAKLDPGGLALPIHVDDEGTIDLAPPDS